jgi:mannose-6-phosphate isomerase-like protein (cupin superfamily)
MLRCTSGARVDLLSATVSSGHLTAPLVLNFLTSGDLGQGTAMASHPALLRGLGLCDHALHDGDETVWAHPAGARKVRRYGAMAESELSGRPHADRAICAHDSAPNPSPLHFEGSVANIGRDWSMTITSAPPGPPRRIDGYTIGAIPNIDGPGPHGGEVHPDGDEFLYIVSGTMELILDDGDDRAVGVETTALLRSGDAYVVPRGVWHRLEPVEQSYLVHVTPGPNGEYRPRNSDED